MSLLNEENKWILDHVESEIVEAEADMEVMEYALEDVYSERLETDFDFYQNAPVMLMHCHQAVLQELESMKEKFIATEEYEKCSVIQKVTDKLIQKFNITVKP